MIADEAVRGSVAAAAAAAAAARGDGGFDQGGDGGGDALLLLLLLMLLLVLLVVMVLVLLLVLVLLREVDGVASSASRGEEEALSGAGPGGGTHPDRHAVVVVAAAAAAGAGVVLVLGNVDLEGALGSEGLLAPEVGAPEGLFLGVAFPAKVGVFVGTHVLGQVSGLTEVLPAPWVLAGEGTLARVDSDVLDEVGGLWWVVWEGGRESVSECGWVVNGEACLGV